MQNLTSCANGTPPNFVNSEYWIGTDFTQGFQTWIEQGIKDGAGADGTNHNYSWFWAEQPPGKDYEEHYPDLTTTPNVQYTTAIEWVTEGQWSIGRDSTSLATAWFNPPSGLWAEAGAEFTENDSPVLGEDSNLEWTGADGTVHSGWSASGYGDPRIIQDQGSSVIWINEPHHFQYSFGSC